MTASETTRAIVRILEQGPRLNVEAAARTENVNEAYLMAHGAVARALERNASGADQSAAAEPDGKVVL